MLQGARASLILPVTLGVMFAALMVLATPVLAGIALAALAALLFVVTQPKRGFLLFCLLAPALPWMTISLGVRITTSEALLALTWLGVFWHWLAGTLPGIRFGSTERLVALFLGWTMVPLIVGQFIPEGDGIGPVNWVRYLLNVSPIALLPILAPTPREREQVILCLLLGFALLACISLGFFFAGRDARLMVPFLAAGMRTDSAVSDEVLANAQLRPRSKASAVLPKA